MSSQFRATWIRAINKPTTSKQTPGISSAAAIRPLEACVTFPLLPVVIEEWSHPPGSNRRPADYESAALPAELGWPRKQLEQGNSAAFRKPSNPILTNRAAVYPAGAGVRPIRRRAIHRCIMIAAERGGKLSWSVPVATSTAGTVSSKSFQAPLEAFAEMFTGLAVLFMQTMIFPRL